MIQKKLNHKPVIIIGAPRSGTKMLRNIITSFDNVSTWPFDEINFMWRHGHEKNKSDKFSANDIDENKRNYMREQFNKLSNIKKSQFIVEKTCANSLRVPYVNKVLPEAKFIYIYRNKYDVIESIFRCWKNGHNKKNFIKKISWYNRYDLLEDIYNIFISLMYEFVTGRKKLEWGPKLEDGKNIIEEKDLLKKSIYQWFECVSQSKKSEENISDNQKLVIKYEDLVTHPYKFVSEISRFLEIPMERYNKNDTKNITSMNIGKGKKELDPKEVKYIENTIAYLEN